MYTEIQPSAEQWTEEELLARKRKAILISLSSFAENYRKETTDQLNQIWIESLSTLSLDQIAEGAKRCLRESEFFPTVATFLEKATERSAPRDQWHDVNPDVGQIDYHRKRVPMPDEFKKLLSGFCKKVSIN